MQGCGNCFFFDLPVVQTYNSTTSISLVRSGNSERLKVQRWYWCWSLCAQLVADLIDFIPRGQDIKVAYSLRKRYFKSRRICCKNDLLLFFLLSKKKKVIYIWFILVCLDLHDAHQSFGNLHTYVVHMYFLGSNILKELKKCFNSI